MYQIDLAAYRGGLSEEEVAARGSQNKDLRVRYLLYLCFAGGKEVGVIYAVICRTAPPMYI